jgi:hypothetical protein
MPLSSEGPFTGGCQCGAVRFAAGRLGRGSICHCRMCQKAFGGFFGPLASSFDVIWTRGQPSYFQSSDRIRRGFCSTCGTPLTYEHTPPAEDGSIEIAIAAFDDPRVAPPTIQVNLTDKLPFVDGLADLPVLADYPPGYLEELAAQVSHQHPDHDTDTWPPAEGFKK